jgi:phosphoglycerate dehydrogenase-like enzyme
MKLVLHPRVDDERAARIRAVLKGELVNAASMDEALAAIADSDAFFGKISQRLLASARRLRWIQCPTVSLEHYLFPELIRHPATLTNMRGIFSDVIADHVMGFILCFARNLHVYVRRQAEGRWQPCGGEEARPDLAVGAGRATAMDLATTHLAGQKLGILGFGAIGRELARRASAFGMSILAVDMHPEASSRRDDRGLPESLSEVWPSSRLDEMLALADFVCISAPHTPLTYKLFRRSRLRRMKPTARLINVGRGAIVDLDDLAAAIEAKEIAGAALDVFDTEPLPATHALWRSENVIITPHVAGCSPRVAERHLEVVLENIRRFQSGKPLLNVVDKEKWY